MKKYYWQDLPVEIQNDFIEQMKGSLEDKDDYINTHNFHQSLGEWEKTVKDYNK